MVKQRVTNLNGSYYAPTIWKMVSIKNEQYSFRIMIFTV